MNVDLIYFIFIFNWFLFVHAPDRANIPNPIDSMASRIGMCWSGCCILVIGRAGGIKLDCWIEFNFHHSFYEDWICAMVAMAHEAFWWQCVSMCECLVLLVCGCCADGVSGWAACVRWLMSRVWWRHLQHSFIRSVNRPIPSELGS